LDKERAKKDREKGPGGNPPPPPLILVKKEDMTVGRKASRAAR